MDADELQKLARAYQPACVLAAAADLELFDAIGADALDAHETAARIHGDLRGTTILLDALAALELLEKQGEHYSVPPALRPLLAKNAPRSVLAWVEHQANCMRRWARLAEAVRGGEPVQRTPSLRGEQADQAAFIEAMDAVNREAAAWLVGELTPVPFTNLLDLGGASGTWTIAWLEANPGARATLFDLPQVIPLARARLAQRGLLDRVELVAGDFDSDPLPKRADLAWVSAIVHQNSRGQNRALFAKVHAALVPGGSILIRDIVMDPSRTKPVAGALFAMHMLAATPGGGTFTYKELAQDLLAGGFAEPAQLREDEWMHAVVAAHRP